MVAARLARTVEALRAIVVPRLMVASVTAAKWAETPLGAAAVGGATSTAIDLLEDGDVSPEAVLWGALLGATESIVLSPGRSRGYVELTPSRLALMDHPARRRQLLSIARARSPQDVRPFSVPATQGKTHHKHADVFGVSPKYNKATAAQLDRAMKTRRQPVDSAHRRHLEEATSHHLRGLRHEGDGRLSQ